METCTQKMALVSVADKRNVVELATTLINRGYQIISTGGTYKKLHDNFTQEQRSKLLAVSAVTEFPELLGGRVKTLHPKIFGGLLAKNTDEHQQQCKEHAIPSIDVIAVNLYPFKKTIEQEDVTLDAAIENIDIGGVALLRAAAKNFARVTVLSDPNDYAVAQQEVSEEKRKQLAVKAFSHTADYDTHIANYLSEEAKTERTYKKVQNLKYGCNPHQDNAAVYTQTGAMPFEVLNGSYGYINLLDALGAWQLVKEASALIQKPCVTSFKHVSPAGAAVPGKLSEFVTQLYGDQTFSLVANAFLRARYADPKSSFGDFLACSTTVDAQTAELISKEVSDGIIAPNFEPEALALLKNKKKGGYVVLKADPLYENNNDHEFRELYGIALSQRPNTATIDPACFEGYNLSEQTKEDLLLAAVTTKYTQSNSVVYAYEGQVIGTGAGQQSRIDCVKLAGSKAKLWYLRNYYPQALSILSLFKPDVSRVDKINAIISFLETGSCNQEFLTEPSKALDLQQQKAFLQTMQGVSLSSDAFFPFRDNIDEAARNGVQYIIQPGGSIRDESVARACTEHDITMVLSGLRLFTH